jgi:hypothetical protein
MYEKTTTKTSIWTSCLEMVRDTIPKINLYSVKTSEVWINGPNGQKWMFLLFVHGVYI